MKKMLIKLREKVRGDFEEGKQILLVLLSYPFAFVFVLLLFVIGLLADLTGFNPIWEILEIIGMAVIAALLAVIIMCIEHPKVYIGKIFFFSLLWFASCLVLVDFSQFSWQLFFKIVTAFEFIFLGCLLPDLVSELKSVKEKQEGNTDN